MIGCSLSSASPLAPTPSPEPVAPAETPSTAVAAGVDTACEHAEFSAQQFTGAWTEPGETTVTTLGGDYTLTSSRGGAGAWSFMPWASTPGKSSMPAGEDHHCVLWLHWQTLRPPMDLVFTPLAATSDLVELSYVGRGNTVTWIRPHPST